MTRDITFFVVSIFWVFNSAIAQIKSEAVVCNRWELPPKHFELRWQKIDLKTPSIFPKEFYELSSRQAVYDSKRKRVIYLDNETTWFWSNSQWAKLPTGAARPTAVREFSMSYDPNRDRVVLFGGKDKSGNLLNETWEFDGQTWQMAPIHPMDPEIRSLPSLGYDAEMQRTVLFGGQRGDKRQILGDFWEWDGKIWSWIDESSPGSFYGAQFISGKNSLVLLPGLGWIRKHNIWHFKKGTLHSRSIVELAKLKSTIPPFFFYDRYDRLLAWIPVSSSLDVLLKSYGSGDVFFYQKTTKPKEKTKQLNIYDPDEDRLLAFFSKEGVSAPQVWELRYFKKGNRAPAFSSVTIPNGVSFVGDSIDGNVYAFDNDADELAFFSDDLPKGAKFSSGKFDWTPVSSDVGKHEVTFVVSDGEYCVKVKRVFEIKNFTYPVLPRGKVELEGEWRFSYVLLNADISGRNPNRVTLHLYITDRNKNKRSYYSQVLQPDGRFLIQKNGVEFRAKLVESGGKFFLAFDRLLDQSVNLDYGQLKLKLEEVTN